MTLAPRFVTCPQCGRLIPEEKRCKICRKCPMCCTCQKAS